MPRPSKYSPERIEIRKEAERIVAFIREFGPVTMGDILTAWEQKGEMIEPHVLNRALRKSPFIVHIGYTSEDDGKKHLWAFEVDE
ncbi:MAG: hypothetical protein O2866_00195 [archaeon]|jgi:hypothetical protein|nr:hypothetical protein [archaeon]MDA1167285.1 hypothetical protein [archaeon]